jgi:hypothetical protein
MTDPATFYRDLKRVQKMKVATGTVVTPIEAARLAYWLARQGWEDILAAFLKLPRAGRSYFIVRSARTCHRCFGAEYWRAKQPLRVRTCDMRHGACSGLSSYSLGMDGEHHAQQCHARVL